MSEPWVDLTEAIEGLRSALMDAVARGVGEGMHFRLSPVELTLEAVLTKEFNGKIGWKVLEAGGSRESAATQTLKLSLTPVWQLGDGQLVEDPLISAELPPTAQPTAPASGLPDGPVPTTTAHAPAAEADEEDDA